jgi:FkbM family methyltransferase
MKIGRRNFRQMRQLLSHGLPCQAITRLFLVHDHPIQVILEEAFARHRYPWTVTLRTPMGRIQATLHSPSDLSTANLVFCRQDYYLPYASKAVIDIGSNIGLSTLFWLTRSPEAHVYCYEPAPRSYQRLLSNLGPYAGRFTPHELAVSDFRGTAELGMDPSGVHSSLDPSNRATEFCEVRVQHINDVLEAVLQHHNRVDMLKLDNEGHELRTLRAIAPEMWGRIGCINVGCHDNRAVIPQGFRKSRVGSAERFLQMA